MKSMKASVGNAFLMWIVGIFPMLLPVLYYAFVPEGRYYELLASVALLLGGLLCIPVLKERCGISVKEHFSPPNVITALLVIASAFFYIICVLFIVYRSMMDEDVEADAMRYFLLVLASTVVPVGEELIFRFAMLTPMLIASENRLFKNVFSILLVSVCWMVMHFSFTLPRVMDLMIVGCILGFIYLKTKNIVYSILFHITANATTYIFAFAYRWLFAHGWILYASIVLFVVCGVLLIRRISANQVTYRSAVETNSI